MVRQNAKLAGFARKNAKLDGAGKDRLFRTDDVTMN